MTLKTVIIHWSGPHSLDDVCASDKSNGIYLLTGKKKYGRTNQIQYCGITEGQFCNRINKKHHKLPQIIDKTLAIWLGKITYPARFNRSHLELAESCFVFFWSPELNERKKINCPSQPICFISQWFTSEGKTRLIRPPIVKGLPDLLWWDNERWRTSKLSVWYEEND
jgi:hypothetical protein